MLQREQAVAPQTWGRQKLAAYLDQPHNSLGELQEVQLLLSGSELAAYDWLHLRLGGRRRGRRENGNGGLGCGPEGGTRRLRDTEAFGTYLCLSSLRCAAEVFVNNLYSCKFDCLVSIVQWHQGAKTARSCARLLLSWSRPCNPLIALLGLRQAQPSCVDSCSHSAPFGFLARAIPLTQHQRPGLQD